MLNIVSVSLTLAVNVLLEMRRIAHQHIHIGSEAREDVKHVTSGEPVQTEPGDSLDGHVHTAECTDIDHADRLTVLIADILHRMKQQILIRVPVNLLEIQDSDGGKVVHELCGHLYFLLYDVVRVVIF